MAKSGFEIQDPSTGGWSPYTGQSGTGNIRSGGTTYSYYAGQNAYNAAPDDPAAAPDPGPIPTNPDGSQVGGGTSWDPGASAPSSAPPGYHWDPDLAMFQPDAASDTSTPPPSGSTPPPNTGTPSTPPPVAPPAQPSGGPTPPPATAAPPAVAPPAAPAASPTPPQVATPDPAQAAYNQSIRDALLRAINAPGVTADDPDIAPAIQANRVANQRMLEQQRDAIAERLNAQGLAGSGALDQQMAQAFQQTGERTGQFAGNAMLQQALARRQQLVSLLSSGAGMVNAEEARQAQLKIADLDAFLRQQGITNQNQQANDQMGLQGAYYTSLLNNQSMRDMLGI